MTPIAIILIIGCLIYPFLAHVTYYPIKDSDYMKRKEFDLVQRKLGRDIKRLITPFLDWLENKLNTIKR